MAGKTAAGDPTVRSSAGFLWYQSGDHVDGLFGVISFELDGQRPQVAGGPGDRDAFFAGCVRRRISFIGIS